MQDDQEDTDHIQYEVPDLDVYIRPVSYYENSMLFPRELMNKIFEYAVQNSEKPLNVLCNLGKVCNSWRLICLSNSTLWNRIDLSLMPLTDRNVKKLKHIFMSEPPRTRHVHELTFGRTMSCKDARNITFLEELMSAPNLRHLTFKNLRTQSRSNWSSLITKTIANWTYLKALYLIDAKCCFSNQKWLADYIIAKGRELEELNLAMSLSVVSAVLFRSIGEEYCPKLRLLDLSTCDNLITHSFDTIQLVQRAPNLEILRLGNISFRRVEQAPEEKGLKKLKELSIPIAWRDADRDDPLIATLTYGSKQISSLDLRGCSMSPYALLHMPSNCVQALHIDDMCPINRPNYEAIIHKWRHSLRILSLTKINCADTVGKCLRALKPSDQESESCVISDVDLSASDINPIELAKFLKSTKSLVKINLSSCRSLPRGCKGQFWRDLKKAREVSAVNTGIPVDQRTFSALVDRLDPDATDDDTFQDCIVQKKRPARVRRPPRRRART